MTPATFNCVIIGPDNALTQSVNRRLLDYKAAVNTNTASADGIIAVHVAAEGQEEAPPPDDIVWPLLLALKESKVRGRMPRYAVIVIAGHAPELLALTRAQIHYVTADTLQDELHVNIIYTDYYGPALTEHRRRQLVDRFGDDCLISEEQITDAVVSMMSGFMDGIKAQVIPLRQGLPAVSDVLAGEAV